MTISITLIGAIIALILVVLDYATVRGRLTPAAIGVLAGAIILDALI